MDIQKIWSRVKNNTLRFFAPSSIIVSKEQFLKELDRIERISLSENVSHTMRFALFRANLYNIGFGGSIFDDFSAYTQYVKTIELTHLLISSIHSTDLFSITFKNKQVNEKYQQVVQKNNFIIYNTFHFGAFISLVDYLAFKNEDVYVLVSSWMQEKPLENNDNKVGAFRSKFKSKVNVKLINSNDISCLLQLKELKDSCQKSSKKIAIVTLIDGNFLELRKGESRNTGAFLGDKVNFQQHITNMAEKLETPLVHCYMTIKEKKLILSIHEVLDFGQQLVSSNEAQYIIFNDFEQLLHKESVGMWTLVADLHITINKNKFPKDIQLIEENNYNETRFTEVYLGHDLFIFDSKYYILYEVNKSKKLDNIKERVIVSKIII